MGRVVVGGVLVHVVILASNPPAHYCHQVPAEQLATNSYGLRGGAASVMLAVGAWQIGLANMQSISPAEFIELIQNSRDSFVAVIEITIATAAPLGVKHPLPGEYPQAIARFPVTPPLPCNPLCLPSALVLELGQFRSGIDNRHIQKIDERQYISP